jgi:Stress responsive A/B Barrel Domain
MMKHIVLFRRKADVAPNAELERALVQRMDALGTQIDVIRSWRLSANELARPVCWNYVLESEVDDALALDAYLFHPLHQALVVDLRGYFEWAAVDYTVPA